MGRYARALHGNDEGEVGRKIEVEKLIARMEQVLLYLPTYLPTHPPTYLYLPTYVPTYLPTYLPPTHLPTHLRTYEGEAGRKAEVQVSVPTCLLTCLPTYLPTYTHTYLGKAWRKADFEKLLARMEQVSGSISSLARSNQWFDLTAGSISPLVRFGFLKIEFKESSESI